MNVFADPHDCEVCRNDGDVVLYPIGENPPPPCRVRCPACGPLRLPLHRLTNPESRP